MHCNSKITRSMGISSIRIAVALFSVGTSVSYTVKDIFLLYLLPYEIWIHLYLDLTKWLSAIASTIKDE